MAEIEYLLSCGVRLVVSTMRTRHNLSAYEAVGLGWHHVPVARTEDGVQALDELLPLLRRELKRPGAAAIHGDSYTDFVAAVCAAHVHELRGTDPATGLAQAARAGLTVTPTACALVGVEPEDVRALLGRSH